MKKLMAIMLIISICFGTAPLNTGLLGSLSTAIITEAAKPSAYDKAVLTEREYVASQDNVKLIGRTFLLDKTLWLANPGTGIEFKFTGTKAEITLIGDNIATSAEGERRYCRVGIYVNGKLVSDELMNKQQKTITAYTSRKSQSVTIRVLKLTEASQSTVGIAPIKVLAGSRIQPTQPKPYHIEFIGDSITCGYGVEASDQYESFTTSTENVTKTYAYLTAEALNADYSIVAASGYGIISGHTSDSNVIDKKRLLPSIYDKIGRSGGLFNSKIQVDTLQWDFKSFRPELIVINLGTNDASYCKTDKDKLESFTQEYIRFLKTIRDKNPDAAILCTYGMMGGNMFPYIETAAQLYSEETGDENIYTMKFDPPQRGDGYGASWHPSITTHKKAAVKLISEIQRIMKW